MGRLRFKLSQRHSKAKDRKVHHGKMMHTKRSSSSSNESRSQHQQIPANNGLPRIPYIRCGFLQGKPPKVQPSSDEQQNTKLPQSPVNKKAADIPFPSAARGASVPVLSSSPATPLPKKWLTLGCDPCKQHNKLRHEDYKLQRRASPATAAADAAYDADDDDHRGAHRTRARGASASASPAACSSVAGKDYERRSLQKREDWEQEMCWKVVGRSENEVVRKQVVPQKKSLSSSASKHSKSPSQEHHHHQQQQQQQHLNLAAVAMKNNFSRSVDWFNDEAPDAATGFVSARNSCDSRKPGSEIGVFKLMTASPDQSLENDSYYAWEKDLSPFASESSIFTSFDSPQNLNKSSSNRISVSPENRRLSSSSRYSTNMLKSPSPAKDDRKRSPHSQLKKEELQRRPNWISPLPSPLFDEFQDTQKGCEDPEAVCRSWEGFRPCPSPLNIDQDTADYRNSSSNSTAPACSNHSSKTSSNEQMLEYLSSQEDELKHVKRKDCKKKHKEQRQEFTSRVMESFAVQKSSFNPYKDFRESMIEMILKKDLFQHRDLEELLRSYLMLNDVELHDLIVLVFTDLWYQLFSYDSS